MLGLPLSCGWESSTWSEEEASGPLGQSLVCTGQQRAASHCKASQALVTGVQLKAERAAPQVVVASRNPVSVSFDGHAAHMGTSVTPSRQHRGSL